MSSTTWTDEQLIQAVANSKTLLEVARNLGLRSYGANTRTIKKHIARLQLSTSHFLSKSDQLAEARKLNKHKPLNEIFCQNNIDRKYIKNTILKYNLIEYKCNVCNIVEWNGQQLSLHLDHINGINNDNRLDNLRFLCPNCHSLTNTYCGKSLTGISRKPIKLCLDCNATIHRNSSRCRSCAAKRQKCKIVWPELNIVLELVEQFGYTQTDKQLGVSGNSVKKHIKNNITYKDSLDPQS